MHRIDYQIIADLIENHSSVLDLGCGNGDLLKMLVKEKDVTGEGIERDLNMVNFCLEKGLPVINGNLDRGLLQYKDKSFDCVILSLTLQSLKRPDFIVKEMVRIGKKAIVTFPNFGYYLVRFSLLFKGKMPKIKFLPHEWYDTPNIHLCTINDFKKFCKKENIKIVQKIYLKKNNNKILGILPNFFASMGIFVLEF